MITPEKLAEIKDYCAKATAGPWFVNNYRDSISQQDPATHPSRNKRAVLYIFRTPDGIPSQEDKAFIAQARTDLPLLVEEVERLNGRFSDYEGGISKAAKDCASEIIAEWLDGCGDDLERDHSYAARAIQSLVNQSIQLLVKQIEGLESDLSAAQRRIEELEKIGKLLDWWAHSGTNIVDPQVSAESARVLRLIPPQP